jgi:hypothetical protein
MGIKIMTVEQITIRKETVLIYLNELHYNSPGETEKNRKTPQSEQPTEGPNFEPGTREIHIQEFYHYSELCVV